MKNKLISAFKYLIFLLAGIAIIYYLFKTYYTQEFIIDLKSVKLLWVFIALFCATLANIFRALRWQLMIAPLEDRKAAFLPVFNAIMVGYLVNLALPRAGEVARCAYLSKKEKFNTLSLLGSVIAERVFDLILLLLIVILSVFLYSELIASFLIDINFNSFLNHKLPFLTIIGLTLALLVFVFSKLSQINNPFLKRFKGFYVQLKQGILAVKSIKEPVLFVVYSIVIWIFYILSTYFGFLMLEDTAVLNFSASILTVVAGSFGMIAPIQGGIGAYHFMVSKCLLLLGVNGTAALVFATILHASQTVAVLFLGLLALIPKVNKTV